MALIDLTNQTFGRLTVLYRDTEAEKLKKAEMLYGSVNANVEMKFLLLEKIFEQAKLNLAAAFKKSALVNQMAIN